MLYLDSSVLLARYLDQPLASTADRMVASDPLWCSARHTAVEVRRNLARALAGSDLAEAHSSFVADWAATNVIELDATTIDIAAGIAEVTGARTLDALHLGAAQRLGAVDLSFATFDLRQAQSARSLGLAVISG